MLSLNTFVRVSNLAFLTHMNGPFACLEVVLEKLAVMVFAASGQTLKPTHTSDGII